MLSSEFDKAVLLKKSRQVTSQLRKKANKGLMAC